MLLNEGKYSNPYTIKLNMEILGVSYPVAEELARKGLYLPSSSGLKEDEIRYICDAIKERIT